MGAEPRYVSEGVDFRPHQHGKQRNMQCSDLHMSKRHVALTQPGHPALAWTGMLLGFAGARLYVTWGGWDGETRSLNGRCASVGPVA